MNTKTIASLFLAAGVAATARSETPAADPATAARAPLVIAEQGFFASGGSVTAPRPGEYDETKNWLDESRADNTAHVDHASTLYQIPAAVSAPSLSFGDEGPTLVPNAFGLVYEDAISENKPGAVNLRRVEYAVDGIPVVANITSRARSWT